MAMKQVFLLALLFAAVCFAQIPSPSVVRVSNLQGCADEFDPKLDYFPDKIESNIAQHFEVEYFNSFKIVRNIVHDETYILYQCGTPRPGTDDRVPLPQALPDDAKFFEIPLRAGVALPDTTIITFVELLGVRNTVWFISSYYTSPCFKKLVDAGQVKLWTPASASQTTAIFSWGNNPGDAKHIAAGSLTGDPGTLNRAEWIEYISTFFNREAVASVIFSNIQSRYHCHSDTARSFANKPTLLWIGYSSFPFSQTPRFTISSDPYVLEYLFDSGAKDLNQISKREFLFGVNPQTNQFEDESAALKATLLTADVIIDETYGVSTLAQFLTRYGLENETDLDASPFKFLQNRQVYTLDKYGGGAGIDWWESALPEPDVVLEDLIEIMHPNYQSHERTWFRNIAIGEKQIISDASMCPNVNELLPLRADCCSGVSYCPAVLKVELTPVGTQSVGSAAFVAVSWVMVIVLSFVALF